MFTAKALFGNTDTFTSQAFIFNVEDSQITFLITSSGEDAFAKTRKIGLQLCEEYQTFEGTASENFEYLLKFIKNGLQDLEEVDVLIAVTVGDLLYIEQTGNFSIYLKKDGKVIFLGNSVNNLVSGFIKMGDSVIFFSKFTEDQKTEESAVKDLLYIPLEDFNDSLYLILQKEQIEIPVSAVILHSVKPHKNEQKQKNNLPKFQFPKLSIINRFHRPSLNRLVKVLPTLKRLLVLIKNHRKYQITALIIVILLVVFINQAIRAFKNEKQKDQQVAVFYSQASDDFEQAKTLAPKEPDQAEEKINQALDDLTQALKFNPSDSKSLALQKNINDSKGSILHIYNITNFPAFLSLDLIKSGFQASRLALSDNDLLLLDTNTKTLVAVDLTEKTNQILAGAPQLGSALFADMDGSVAYSYSQDKGVVEVDTDSGAVQNIIKPDPQWGLISDIFVFGENIYLLDELKGQIWKYIPNGSGYTSTNYLTNNTDLTGEKRMRIDGSIWVLRNDMDIEKFTQNAPDSFYITGVDNALNQINEFYLSDQTQNIYLLDNQNSRMIVLKKTGQYIEEYTGDKFKTAEDLAVDEKNKKIYLLSNNTIYQLDLK